MENSTESCIEELRHNAVVRCVKNGCPNRKSDTNKYCGKHQIWIFLDETSELGMKTCVNYIRGCREQLDKSYKFTRCEDCLKRDREKDKEKREAAKKKDSDAVIKTDSKICSFCHIEQHIDRFNGVKGGETKTCADCRDNFKKIDANRDKEKRNAIARKNERKPENVAVKKKWKEENYDKVAGYWMKSRQNKIEKDGIDEYQKKNAENAKNWRDSNPEKVLIINENKRKNLKLQYNVYFRSARDKNLDFQLSNEEYEKIVCGNCYYCGTIADKGFNGIDRKDQTQGYVIENCVNCCQMCNYMKKSLSYGIFTKRIEHILVHNKIIEKGNLYPEIFSNHIYGINFKTYQHSASRKKFDFDITEYQFKKITSEDCYICGKNNSSEHHNGIDRYDSKIGYLFENCRSCCGECNYMKNNYDYEDMFDKFTLIYNNLNGKNCLFKKISTVIPALLGKLHENVFIPENEINDGSNLINTIILSGDDDVVTFNPEKFMPLVESTGLSNNFTEKSDKKEDIQNNISENIFVANKNKKTADEKREAARLRKQQQRKRLVEKYGDEEYKKMHAQQIAENRRKKT
jgi:hypothetical protein